MDLIEIKEGTLKIRDEMISHGFRFDGAILFGSFAKGTQTPQSDVDLAIISKHFGSNPFKEGALMNRLAYRVFPRAEIVSVSLKDYLDPKSISPILFEIKSTGLILF
jgi:predicted nucleotidyltransferase